MEDSKHPAGVDSTDPGRHQKGSQRDRRPCSKRSLPHRFVLLHKGKDAAHDLVEHLAQVCAGVLRVMQLRAQETLADPKPSAIAMVVIQMSMP